MNNRYSGGTGSRRGNQMYDYSQPSMSQYESFFNPIPLDFVQQNLQEHQDKYDVGFASGIAAKDQFGGTKVGNPDIAYKNQLINQFTNDTDKMVKDQFGGDWGKAAKTVARSITEVRNNDFWNLANNTEEQRKLEREHIAQYGPDAIVVNSIGNKSVIDPATGRMRSSQDLTSNVMKKGDWEKSVAGMFAGLQPEITNIALSRYQGDSEITGFLQSGGKKEISDTKLYALAHDKDIVSAFLNSNPDFQIANEKSDYFGGRNVDAEGKKIDTTTYAGDQIYGMIKSRQLDQTDINYIDARKDPNSNTSGSRTAGGSTGNIISNAGPNVKIQTHDPKVTQEERRSLQTQKKAWDANPSTDAVVVRKKAEINQKISDLDSNVNFIYGSMQSNPDYKVDMDKYYQDYKGKTKTPISKDEFDNLVQENFKSGTREVDHDPSGSPMGGGSIYSNDKVAINKAIDGVKDSYNKYLKSNQLSMNVNVLTGTVGDKGEDTVVGQVNKLATETWLTSQTDYTLPYNNSEQITTTLNGKKYKDRDPENDKIRIADGTINGKFVYQLAIYDKNKNPIGSEYIAPKDQDNLRANLIETGQNMMNIGAMKGNNAYMEQGKTILLNAQYGESVQQALHSNDTGVKEFKGVTFGKQNIKFENRGTVEKPQYVFYVNDKDGKKDYFAEDSADSKPYIASSEAQVKSYLNAFQVGEVLEGKRTDLTKVETNYNKEGLSDYLDAIGKRESGNNPASVNSKGYIGEYQFGDAALKETGYEHINRNAFKKDPSIWSREEQQKAMIKLMSKNEQQLTDVISSLSNMQEINGIKITKSGVLAAAHIGGAGGVKKYFASNGKDNPADAYGTTIEDYLLKFSGYNL